MQRALRTLTALGAIALAGVARAQSGDPDLDQLFKERSEPPLIGILFDNSGSMRNVVWNAAPGKFNPKKFYDLASGYSSDCRKVGGSSGSLDVPKMANTAKVTTTPKRPGVCVGSGESDDSCPDNERTSTGSYLDAGEGFECKRSYFSSSSSYNPCPTLTPTFPPDVPPPATPGGKPPPVFKLPTPPAPPSAQRWACEKKTISGTDWIRFTLPDHTPGSVETQWSKNYLGWIISEIKAGRQPVIPHADRLETMKVVLKNTIRTFNPTTHNEKARFALWGFDQASTQGSKIHEDFNNSSRAELDAAIDSLVPNNGTPLAESVTEIAQHISGNQAIGVNRDLRVGPITEDNPMQDELCSKSFIVAITDGEPSEDNFAHYSNVRVNSAGKIVTSGGTVMNSFKWSVGDVVGAKEGNANDPNAPPYDAASGKPPVPPYSDNGTDWLDDITYFLSHTDLRPDDAPGADAIVGEQSIVSYMIGFSQDHALLSSAAAAGKGKFFTANTSEDLTSHLENAIKDILLSSGSFSAVSIPAARTSTSDALFTPFFEPSSSENFWPGHLQSYRIIDDPTTDEIEFIVADEFDKPAINTDTGDFIEPLGRYIWDAGRCLADPTLTVVPRDCYIAAGSRSIFFNKTKGTPPSTPPTRADFKAANVTAAELAVSDTAELAKFPKVYGTTTELKDAVIGYVRGQDTFDTDPKDGDSASTRTAVLGDIFHSSPLVIGQPSTDLAAEPGFGPLHGPPGVEPGPATFLDDHFRRERLIYVGTNDGMLHGFSAGTLQDPDGIIGKIRDEFYSLGNGKEKFGYIANDSLPLLRDMARIETPKPYFMDGSPVAADAWLPTTATDPSKERAEWATVLLSGMRNGGDSVLALDVTNPAAATFPKPLWEFTYPGASATEAGLGNTWSTPVITRVKLEAGMTGDFCGASDGDGDSDGAGPDKPDCQETWVAIFGGGYLAGGDPSLLASYIKPGDPGWNPDSRSIFIVRLKEGTLLARVGYNAADTDLKEMKYPIPSNPAVADLNGDGFSDVIYVGDIGGQMWKWDISAVAKPDPTTKLVSPSTWRAARFFVSPPGTNQHLRQIFYPPSLSFIQGMVTLAFGTGERTNLNYPTLPGIDENHYYVVRDSKPIGTGAFDGLPLGPGNLTLLEGLSGEDGNPSDLGFYFAAANKHEKFLTESIAVGGSVIMLSYDPELEGDVEKCGTRGRSLLYMFSLTDGAPTWEEDFGQDGRRLELGGGVPSTPRFSKKGRKAHIAVQTSRGLFVPKGTIGDKLNAVEWLFWREL